MLTYAQRLKALRAELSRRDLYGFIVPLTDEHMSEYVGAYARRLAWLTGFHGSAGTAAVLSNEAAIFVDGRYTLQARQQVGDELWNHQTVPPANVVGWIAEHATKGSRIGYDPWLHTRGWVNDARRVLAASAIQLVAVETNPIDSIWSDKPAPPRGDLTIHPDVLAGKSSREKRRDIAQWLAANKADTVVLSLLDSIAWAFNLRGSDVDYTPVARAFALVNRTDAADLFVSPGRLTEDIRQHLGSDVRIHPRDLFATHLATLGGSKVAVDPDRVVSAIFEILEKAGAEIIQAPEPVLLPKAIKNVVEIAGHRNAQTRDGAALSAFLHWFSVHAESGTLTEMAAAARLREFREATGELRGLAFETISAAGPNAASPHYQTTSQSNRRIETGTLYLVDSGGQYRDGTTDVTRTISVGQPNAEMRDRFTRVLKGHIALARAIFPRGTRGGQLDALARQYLWDIGCDYGHGTGHGVGAYLCVHEGPQRIACTAPPFGKEEPLHPGMILSNEPGYYKGGEYGIRIENLVLVVEHEMHGAEHPMLAFETLTFAPLDQRLIDSELLTHEERGWVDAYHTNVARAIGPHLTGEARHWLLRATQPLQ